MSNQELLTFLFNAIALGFLAIATMDFGTRAAMVYKQVSIASNSPLTSAQQPLIQLPPAAVPQALLQLPDPWMLPVKDEANILTKTFLREQKHLRLLPPAKAIDISQPELGDVLQGVDLNKLKLRQARKLAKVLGIAQKVNGRDQKLEFLRTQIKLKLQQAKSEIVEVVKQELLAC